ncbi:MAG TPA: winged helix-turn-helix domain-containing protein [Phycisphaerales bacterium]|nr:winged helix-turn-helix domain-containing protein [Phycisphaerales bacterium]
MCAHSPPQRALGFHVQIQENITMTTAQKNSTTKAAAAKAKKSSGAKKVGTKATVSGTSTGTSSQPQPKTKAPKRLSALDAAAQVLATSDKALRCTEIIAEMQKRELWKSPGGKTPESTLHAAITREIATKGDAARFKKVERGLFAARV